LGHPTPSRYTAWSPSPASPERARDRFPRSACPFCVALGRCFTPGPFLSAVLRKCARKTGIHPHFGASPCPLLADVSQCGLVLHDDAYAPSSNILSVATCLAESPCLAQDLPPFPPASDDVQPPVADDQSHARGRCCHPCTEGIGVDVSHETCYHLTYIDTQLSKIERPLPPIPRITPVSGERVAHTRWSRQRLSAFVVSRLFRFVGTLVQSDVAAHPALRLSFFRSGRP